MNFNLKTLYVENETEKNRVGRFIFADFIALLSGIDL